MALIATENAAYSAPEPGDSHLNALAETLTALPEIAAIRSLMSTLQRLLGRVAGEREYAPLSPAASEHILYIRDLLHATADRLERLSTDASPVRVQPLCCTPVAGSQRWNPEELLPVLSAEVERLARTAQEIATSERLSTATRRALEPITTEFLHNAYHDGAEHLKEAESAMGADAG